MGEARRRTTAGHRQPNGELPTIPVALPGGWTWQQRAAPHPTRFKRWCEALTFYAEHPANKLARVKERMALLGAYDGGWDVTGRDGLALRSPATLSLRGWNEVPRAVIETLLLHLEDEADNGFQMARETAPDTDERQAA